MLPMKQEIIANPTSYSNINRHLKFQIYPSRAQLIFYVTPVLILKNPTFCPHTVFIRLVRRITKREY